MDDAYGEREYLVKTQLKKDPYSFRAHVQEAFLLEYGCVHDYEIMRILDLSEGRMPQMCNELNTTEASTIRHLISKLSSRHSKQVIVESWLRAYFGEDFFERQSSPLLGEEVSDKTVKRIARQLREQRVQLAGWSAMEAYRKTEDPVLQHRSLDLAYTAYLALGYFGRAMQAVRLMHEHASVHRERRRIAAAELFRATIIEAMPDSSPGDVEPIVAHVAQLLAPLPAKKEQSAYALADRDQLWGVQLSAYLTYVERRKLQVDERVLRDHLRTVLKRLHSRLPYQRRFGAGLTAARIHLLLGETFQAEELIDKAFEQGKLKNLRALERCGLLKVRVLLRTESPEAAASYLQRLSTKCYGTQEWRIQHEAEHELARLENDRF